MSHFFQIQRCRQDRNAFSWEAAHIHMRFVVRAKRSMRIESSWRFQHFPYIQTSLRQKRTALTHRAYKAEQKLPKNTSSQPVTVDFSVLIHGELLACQLVAAHSSYWFSVSYFKTHCARLRKCTCVQYVQKFFRLHLWWLNVTATSSSCIPLSIIHEWNWSYPCISLPSVTSVQGYCSWLDLFKNSQCCEAQLVFIT